MLANNCKHRGCLFYQPVQFSCSVVSDSLQPHGLKHARLPCPSPTPGACSNPCPLSRWCHPTIASSVIPFSCLQSCPASGFFSKESVLRIRWPKYWIFSFNISPSNEYSGLISFKIDWFDLLTVQALAKLNIFRAIQITLRFSDDCHCNSSWSTELALNLSGGLGEQSKYYLNNESYRPLI